MKTFIITISTIFIFGGIFNACKPKEVKPEKSGSGDTRIKYINVDDYHVETTYSEINYDSTTKTFYYLIDTTYKDYKIGDTIIVRIDGYGTNKSKTIKTTEILNPLNFTYTSENGDTANYKLNFVIRSFDAIYTYNFESYSEDSIQIEKNKTLTLETINYGIYDAYYTPIFQNQYSNEYDKFYCYTYNYIRNKNDGSLSTNKFIDNKPLAGLAISFGFEKFNRIRSNLIGKYDVSNKNVICTIDNWFLRTTPYDNLTKADSGTLSIVEYNPIANTFSGTIDATFNIDYKSSTTYGVKLHVKANFNNYSLDNTSY